MWWPPLRRVFVQDASIKEINAAPWTKDVLVTAEKRVNGEQLFAAPLCHGCVPTGLR